MNADAIRNLYTQHHRRAATLPSYRREDVPPVVRYVSENSKRSFILFANVTADIVEDTAEREKLYFQRLGHDFEWKVYSYDTPPDLKERLAACGFEIGEEEALLVLDTKNLPEVLQPEATPLPHIREVKDPDAIYQTLQAVQGPVFGKAPWMEHMIRSHKQGSPESLYFVAAYADDQPVSAAWVQFDQPGNPFAGLNGGATLPEYRRQGHYTALIRARVREAQGRDVRFLHVDASPMSRPILEKLGFVYLASAWEANYFAS